MPQSHSGLVVEKNKRNCRRSSLRSESDTSMVAVHLLSASLKTRRLRHPKKSRCVRPLTMYYDLTRPLSPLTELSDNSTSTQSLSSLSQLSDDFLKTVLVLMNDATPTVGHVAEANARLDVFENVPVENRRVGTEIDSLRVLREMLNNAPTERGKRYVACAVICCQGQEQWVRLASDWVHFLLWPCTSRASPTSSLIVYRQLRAHIRANRPVPPHIQSSRCLRQKHRSPL